MTTTPNPLAIFGNRKAAVPTESTAKPVVAPVEYPEAPRPPRLAAHLDLDAPLAGPVRPGFKDTVVTQQHDGVVKTRNLLHGQRVRPLVHGEPRGAERVVDRVERIKNGAECQIFWLSPHSPEVKKSAYRWFDQSWVGEDTDVLVKTPVFVAVHE